MDHEQTRSSEAPSSDADAALMLERWLHDFDVKQAALTARQDAFLRMLGVCATGSSEAA